MKKQKVWIPFLFILFFFIVFWGSSLLWQNEGTHSNAEEGVATAEENVKDKVNYSGSEELITVDTSFYNYLYDNEIYHKKRDQGAQSCYDAIYDEKNVLKELIGIPYGAFDSKLSDYYKTNKVIVGIYTGNFYNYYGTLDGVGDKKLTFPGYYYFKWAANIANRTEPYNSVCQGIVEDELSGFDVNNETSGTLMTGTSKSTEVAVPFFNSQFLSTKATDTNVSIGVVKDHVNFPFRKITSGSKKGYYEFDSTKDVVRFSGMEQGNPSEYQYYFGVTDNSKTAKLDYYYSATSSTNKVYSKASENPQFLPFNSANNSAFDEDEPGTSERQKKLDYGFGVRFNIPFYLSSDGTIEGKNMVFEFSGDDDVWVFLDGKLVMDLGGQHGKATGTIDFSGASETAKVTVAKVTRITGLAANKTATSDMILAKDTYIESNQKSTIDNVKKGNMNKHILTVFYMERGMFDSNFHMAFNFVPEGVPIPETTPEPIINPDAIEDGSLTIENNVVFPTTQDTNGQSVDKINAAFLGTVKGLAENDVFQYSIANKGTVAANVGDSEIKYPSGKLTVRKNGETGKEETSYLSFGTCPKVRVYFDIGEIYELIGNLTDGYQNFKFQTETDSEGMEYIKNLDIGSNMQREPASKLVRYKQIIIILILKILHWHQGKNHILKLKHTILM